VEKEEEGRRLKANKRRKDRRFVKDFIAAES